MTKPSLVSHFLNFSLASSLSFAAVAMTWESPLHPPDTEKEKKKIRLLKLVVGLLTLTSFEKVRCY